MIYLILVAFLLAIKGNNNLGICGDWISYKNEKCFKIINKLGTEDEAKGLCYELDRTSTLVSVETQEEQEFISAQLEKYQTVADKAWMGMNVHELVLNPYNGQNRFTNWAEGSADLIGYHTCVQMSLAKASFGKWTDEPCRRKALIACQRRQQWTVDTLRDILNNILTQIDSQKYETIIENQTKVIERMQKVMERQQKEIKAQNESIDNFNKTVDRKLTKIVAELANDLKSGQDQIPIGFIYAQMANQSEPQIMWPRLHWKDITEEYSGLFFRAEGKDSEPFGKIQQANSSTVSNIMSSALVDITYSKVKGGQYTLKEGWSQNLVPGKALSDFYIHKSNGEIRPRNTAVRFWKRTA